MAGTSIEIDLQIHEVHDAFNRLIQSGQNLNAPMREIARFLDDRTRDHFDKQESPDGIKWDGIKYDKKKFSVDKILHGETLHLRDTIFPFHSEDEAGVSSGSKTQKYAATHQFGDSSRNIPARPFIGIGSEDEDEILGILRDFLSEAF